jgi:hypothetical protein
MVKLGSQYINVGAATRIAYQLARKSPDEPETVTEIKIYFGTPTPGFATIDPDEIKIVMDAIEALLMNTPRRDA